MKDRRVVASKNLQTKSPITVGVVYWLLLDRFNAPGWLYGVVGTIAVIWLFIWIVSWFFEVETEVFPEEKKS